MPATRNPAAGEPVVNYDEATVTDALASLQHKGCVMRITVRPPREKYGTGSAKS